MNKWIGVSVGALGLWTAGFGQGHLSHVVNFPHAKHELKLSKRILKALDRNGFVVTDGDWTGIEDAYGQNVYQEIPSYVTADTILQVVHTTYDSSLRQVEANHLWYSLKRMVRKMLGAAKARYAKAPSSAALRNIEYLAVADRLIGDSFAIPPQAQAKVKAELASVQAQSGAAVSPIFGYLVDYSQFIPRGHYTRSELMKKYFRATMWLGLVPIALEKRVGNKIVPLPDNVKSVKMLVEDWQTSGASKDWYVIDRVVTGFVGPANDITPPKWLAARGVLSRLGPPAMVSHARSRSAMAGDLQFRLLAQRAIPDSVAFSKLTGNQRFWPSSLDVAAVLGSEHAAKLLDASPDVFNPQGWEGYQTTREKLRREWASWPDSRWESDLYHGEFGLLREMLKPIPKVGGAFYQGPAYQDLLLTTILGSWAELRHDSLLYGEQSSAEMGDGDEPKHVKGFVEPRPELYAKARRWVGHLKRILAHEGFLSGTLNDSFGTFAEVLRKLRKFAVAELTGRKPSKSDYDWLWTVEADIAGLETSILIQGFNYNMISEDDSDIAVVADVHTALGMAMEVGTGHADDILAIVPIEGKLYLARGEVLSFYETRVPASKRMTDHVWKEMARNHKLPKRPSWMKSYFVPVRLTSG